MALDMVSLQDTELDMALVMVLLLDMVLDTLWLDTLWLTPWSTLSPTLWPTMLWPTLLATPSPTSLKFPPTPTTTEWLMSTPALPSARASPTTAPELLRDPTQ